MSFKTIMADLKTSGITLVVLLAAVFGMGAWVQSLAADTASLRLLYTQMNERGSLVSQELSKKVIRIEERQDQQLQYAQENKEEHRNIMVSLEELKKIGYAK